MKKNNVHKHKWQFAKMYEPYAISTGVIIKGFFVFVCECGKSKLVMQK